MEILCLILSVKPTILNQPSLYLAQEKLKASFLHFGIAICYYYFFSETATRIGMSEAMGYEHGHRRLQHHRKVGVTHMTTQVNISIVRQCQAV